MKDIWWKQSDSTKRYPYTYTVDVIARSRRFHWAPRALSWGPPAASCRLPDRRTCGRRTLMRAETAATVQARARLHRDFAASVAAPRAMRRRRRLSRRARIRNPNCARYCATSSTDDRNSMCWMGVKFFWNCASHTSVTRTHHVAPPSQLTG